MKRRDFMTKAGIGGVATATALATPAIAQDRGEIAMVSTWPRDFPGLGTGAQRFAKRLGDVSDGRIRSLTTLPVNVLARSTASTKLLPVTHRPTALLTTTGKASIRAGRISPVPFGLSCVEMNAWIAWMGGQDLWDELAGEFGLKSLPWVTPACRWAVGSTRKSTRPTTSEV